MLPSSPSRTSFFEPLFRLFESRVDYRSRLRSYSVRLTAARDIILGLLMRDSTSAVVTRAVRKYPNSVLR